MKKTILSLMLITSSIFAMEGKTMTVYKSPSCGCCSDWIDIMKTKGFKIDVIETNEVNNIKQKSWFTSWTNIMSSQHLLMDM